MSQDIWFARGATLENSTSRCWPCSISPRTDGAGALGAKTEIHSVAKQDLWGPKKYRHQLDHSWQICWRPKYSNMIWCLR